MKLRKTLNEVHWIAPVTFASTFKRINMNRIISHNKKLKLSISSVVFLFGIVILYTSCGIGPEGGLDVETPKKQKAQAGKSLQISTKLAEINFYFENSGSMNGYLDGKNFKQTMHRIIDESIPGFNPFFVNTKEYKTSNLLSKIDSKSIKTQSIGGSDHQFIFENAIKNAIGNNLSIVVTDGIYSMPKGGINVVEVEIEKSFVRALNDNAIETVVLKMSSNYKGTYYTESNCKDVQIDQERPYYILLFGNKKTIDNALKKIVVIDELPGFKEQARFFLTDNLKVNYTILTLGEEKKGSFRKVGRGGSGLVKEIEDAERDDRGSENYLQFAIGIDYSGISIPDSYLLKKENYKIGGTAEFEIEDIKTVENLSNSSTTYSAIQGINAREKIELSHLIIVKSEFNYAGDLVIKLENNIPSWIPVTGSDDDCDIKDNKDQTFAFDKLMTGISKAYSKVGKSDEYLELKVNIKH